MRSDRTFNGFVACFLVATLFGFGALDAAVASVDADSVEYVIHISVDGMRGDVLDVIDSARAPNFNRLRNEGAYTGNARTDLDFTNTMPNHTGMMTGRPVIGAGGHGVTFNDDNGSTIHRSGGYISSTFDVAFDNGLSTGLYYSKDKFVFYSRSWSDKIDVVRYRDDIVDLTTQFVEQMQSRPQQYTFLAYRDLDSIGHARRWASEAYYNAVERVDGEIGRVLELIESDTTFAGKTAIIITADHGGEGTGHGDVTVPYVYTVPEFVWGPGVRAGSNLYEINWSSRAEPCNSRPDYAAAKQPIRNAGTANLAMMLLGLPPVPGSVFNADRELAVELPDSITGVPQVQFETPSEGDVSAPGVDLEVGISASSPNGTITSVSILGNCQELATLETPPFANYTWPTPPLGKNVLQAVATDAMGLFGLATVTFEVAGGVSVDGDPADWQSLRTTPLLDTDSLQSDPELALDRLYITEDSTHYYIGFDAPAESKRVFYALYIDVDKFRFSGADSDPLGFAVATEPLHYPEVVLHLEHRTEDIWSAPLYSSWDPGGFWRTITGLPGDGQLKVDTDERFMELSIPRDATGLNPDQGFFVELVTIGSTSGAGASESIPSDPNITFDQENTSTETTVLSAFANLSFPPLPGDGITVDGFTGDWIRNKIKDIRDTDDLQGDPDFKLNRLYVVHNDENYFFGYDVRPGEKEVWFGLYIDTDGIAGSGGTLDARGNAIGAVDPYLPEVQIYFQNDTTRQWSASGPEYYWWDEPSSSWIQPAGGGLPDGSDYMTRTRFVEMSIPMTAPRIDYAETMNVALFTVGNTPGAGASESVPSNENIAFAGENTSTDLTVLSAFKEYAIRPVVTAREPGEAPDIQHELSHYPNPLSRVATFEFATIKPGPVRLEILDLLGRRVARVTDGHRAAGRHRVTTNTSVLPSGTYVYRLSTTEGVTSRKMVVVR